MVAAEEQFVVDGAGNRSGVLIGMERYSQLIEAFEELEDIRAYDEAIASGDQAIPFEQAIREIEQSR